MMGPRAHSYILGSHSKHYEILYLRSHPIPLRLACPTRANRGGRLYVLLAQLFWPAVSRRRAFSAITPVLWNILLPNVRLVKKMMSFHQGLKIMSFHQGLALPLGPNGGTYTGDDCSSNNRSTSPDPAPLPICNWI